LCPDVIIADISMPNVSGLEALHQLRRDNPSVKVVFLTMHQDSAYARRAVAAGANGYVTKHSAADELIMAVRAALRGQTFISPSVTSPLLRGMGSKTKAPLATEQALTGRQRDILELVSEGRSAKEIAAKLSISPRTVEFHKYQLMQALKLRNTADLIHFAIKQGIAAK
jgi:DNA-binding NarL/FixJ family response regulator